MKKEHLGSPRLQSPTSLNWLLIIPAGNLFVCVMLVEGFLYGVARCWAFISVGVGIGECQSDSFICFGAKTTQRAWSRDLLRDQKKTWEGKVQGQSTEEDRREESSQQKRTVKRREQDLGPVDSEAGLASVRGWVSVPGSCVGIFEYTLVTDTEAQNARKVSQTPTSYAWSSWFLFFFSSTSQFCMLCSVCL